MSQKYQYINNKVMIIEMKKLNTCALGRDKF